MGQIEVFDMLPIWARMDLGAMAVKQYSKAQSLESHYQIVWCHIQDTWRDAAKMQLVYSTVNPSSHLNPSSMISNIIIKY